MAKKNEHEEENVEHVHVEDETMGDEEQAAWTEEFTVAAGELVDFVKNLVREATVRRIVVKNEKHGIHLQIPLVVGVAGIALIPVYASLALIAALVTDCTIVVERVEPAEKAAETAESKPATA